MQIQNAILTGSTTVYGPITFVSGTLAGSASYAATSSYADTFTVAGSLTAQTLVVQTITSSVSFITGSTRFGSLLTNTHEFTGSLRVTGSTISLSNSKVIIGDDGTYGGNISTVGFGGTSNGFNRIAAANNTSDGLYLIAATGRGIYLRPGGKSTQDLSVFPNGNTALGVNFLLPTATLHISGSGSGSLMQISSTVSSSIFFVSGSGNVGIGTTTPVGKLDVALLNTRRFIVTYDDSIITIKGASDTGAGENLRIIGDNIFFYTGSAGSGGELMRLTNTGRVGIGTTIPSSSLEVRVAGESSATGKIALIAATSNGINDVFRWYDGLTQLGVFKNSGYVGIGTTSPDAIFHVARSNSGGLGGQIVIDNTAGSALNNAVEISFLTDAGATGAGTRNARIVAQNENAGNGAANMQFWTWNGSTDAERMRITSGGNVGIGTTNPVENLQVTGNIRVSNRYYINDGTNTLELGANYIQAYLNAGASSTNLAFYTGTAERMRITSGGEVLMHSTSFNSANAGQLFGTGGDTYFTTDTSIVLYVNRKGNDGTLVDLRQDNTTEGTISVSGTTVSYNSFLGSHWSQLIDNSKPEILKGTILETIDELCTWEGETNDRLPKVKISDTVESKKVYGIFLDWDNDDTENNDMYVAAVGAGYIRVNGSQTIQMGDLLQSNGDGTAKIQSDDIMRSSTIAKVISTNKITTYEDSSYLIAATLHCG